jgi:Rrf2 family protein
MKISEGVEWGIHCCTILALLPSDKALPATRLAEYHGVPAAYLAKHLQSLSRAGIVESVAGPKGGYRLARPPADISMLDVVVAIDGADPAFRCTEIRQRGPAAVAAREYRLPCGIARAMWAAEDAWRAELSKRSIGDLVAGVAVDASPKSIEKAITWFQEVVR